MANQTYRCRKSPEIESENTSAFQSAELYDNDEITANTGLSDYCDTELASPLSKLTEQFSCLKLTDEIFSQTSKWRIRDRPKSTNHTDAHLAQDGETSAINNNKFDIDQGFYKRITEFLPEHMEVEDETSVLSNKSQSSNVSELPNSVQKSLECDTKMTSEHSNSGGPTGIEKRISETGKVFHIYYSEPGKVQTPSSDDKSVSEKTDTIKRDSIESLTDLRIPLDELDNESERSSADRGLILKSNDTPKRNENTLETNDDAESHSQPRHVIKSEESNKSVEDEVFLERNEKPRKFYGVALLKGTVWLENNLDILVFEDLKEALKATKKYKGARFKEFSCAEDARHFASLPVPQSTASCSEESSIGVSFPYKSVSSQDLVRFRQAIERGDASYFEEAVENPRTLLGNGDKPTILQEGFRYNALHVAARSKRPEMCRLILDTLSDPMFYHFIFFDDSPEVRRRRQAHIVDHYLNTPDKRLGETPLHFAAKFGCAGSVRVLLSHPQCDPGRRNVDGLTAREIMCSRFHVPSDDLVRDMVRAFEDCMYVPLWRAENNACPPQIGKPCHRVEIMPSAGKISNFVSQPEKDLKPIQLLRGYAGPMSPELAQEFYEVWKSPSSPSREEQKLISNIRLKDTEKGFERIGRFLAKDRDVGWSEYWSALNQFADLSTDEGMEKLESHLFLAARDVLYDEMKNILNGDRTSQNESEDLDFMTPPTSPQDDGSFFTPPDSPPPSFDPFNGREVFVDGKEFSRIDVDMFLALEHREVDPEKYMYTARWQSLVKSKLKSLDEEQDNATSESQPKKPSQTITPLATVAVPKIQRSAKKYDIKRKLFSE